MRIFSFPKDKAEKKKKNMEYPQNLHGHNDLGIWKKHNGADDFPKHSPTFQASVATLVRSPKNVPTTVIKNCQIYQQFG